MFKRLKKELQINIDNKKGHLFLGDDKKDIRLLMLRPIDLIEFSEFAGANADDILIWSGKTIGKELMENYFYEKDWSLEPLPVKKEVFLGVLEGLALMGYGYLNAVFQKDHVLVDIYGSLSEEEKGNIMAKNLCLINQGILNGILEALGFEAEGEETECVLLDDDRCRFKFTLLETDIPEELTDEEKQPEAISDFLSSL
jgi:predicted hydrocarbon binding protein